MSRRLEVLLLTKRPLRKVTFSFLQKTGQLPWFHYLFYSDHYQTAPVPFIIKAYNKHLLIFSGLPLIYHTNGIFWALGLEYTFSNAFPLAKHIFRFPPCVVSSNFYICTRHYNLGKNKIWKHQPRKILQCCLGGLHRKGFAATCMQ